MDEFTPFVVGAVCAVVLGLSLDSRSIWPTAFASAVLYFTYWPATRELQKIARLQLPQFDDENVAFWAVIFLFIFIALGTYALKRRIKSVLFGLAVVGLIAAVAYAILAKPV